MLNIPSSINCQTADSIFYPYIDLVTTTLLTPSLKSNQSKLQLIKVLLEDPEVATLSLSDQTAVFEFPLLSREFDNAASDIKQAIKQQQRSKNEISLMYNELYEVYIKWCSNSKQLERIGWAMWYRELKRLNMELSSLGNVYDKNVNIELVERVNKFFEALGCSDIRVGGGSADNTMSINKLILLLIVQLGRARPEFVDHYYSSTSTSASTQRKWFYNFKWNVFKKIVYNR